MVLLGQDPYHGENQAHGLSFSVASSDAKFPPSLRNIFKELKTDLGIERTNRDLTDWAEQGVLLLNTVLTVDGDEKAGSHRKKGWETFTDHVINTLNMRDKPIVFVLWGNDAKKKIPLITNPKHKIITGVHPSPLSANGGFFGSKPFSQINEALVELGEDTIQW
ncbi:uracil-DNA glycosylase [Listeria fleischmannii FSL S10-1203]|uniref:Uracil-DNA glycosylase n=1 Tax=Listeria fleischmannii FSL S10-1203 TaxID=1265822 RepID=W7DDG2_9LIST|nr:uracil-DNA glycosylase [Listeria fleischmannii FSL S10-1203]